MNTIVDHQIPPMTHELGRYWDQPDRSDILVDDTHAVMSSETYKKLANYDGSIPSGVYEGKMWRCGDTLCWFEKSVTPVYCAIVIRYIICID